MKTWIVLCTLLLSIARLFAQTPFKLKYFEEEIEIIEWDDPNSWEQLSVPTSDAYVEIPSSLHASQIVHSESSVIVEKLEVYGASVAFGGEFVVQNLKIDTEGSVTFGRQATIWSITSDRCSFIHFRNYAVVNNFLLATPLKIDSQLNVTNSLILDNNVEMQGFSLAESTLWLEEDCQTEWNSATPVTSLNVVNLGAVSYNKPMGLYNSQFDNRGSFYCMPDVGSMTTDAELTGSFVNSGMLQIDFGSEEKFYMNCTLNNTANGNVTILRGKLMLEGNYQMTHLGSFYNHGTLSITEGYHSIEHIEMGSIEVNRSSLTLFEGGTFNVIYCYEGAIDIRANTIMSTLQLHYCNFNSSGSIEPDSVLVDYSNATFNYVSTTLLNVQEGEVTIKDPGGIISSVVNAVLYKSKATLHKVSISYLDTSNSIIRMKEATVTKELNAKWNDWDCAIALATCSLIVTAECSSVFTGAMQNAPSATINNYGNITIENGTFTNGYFSNHGRAIFAHSSVLANVYNFGQLFINGIVDIDFLELQFDSWTNVEAGDLTIKRTFKWGFDSTLQGQGNTVTLKQDSNSLIFASNAYLVNCTIENFGSMTYAPPGNGLILYDNSYFINNGQFLANSPSLIARDLGVDDTQMSVEGGFHPYFTNLGKITVTMNHFSNAFYLWPGFYDLGTVIITMGRFEYTRYTPPTQSTQHETSETTSVTSPESTHTLSSSSSETDETTVPTSSSYPDSSASSDGNSAETDSTTSSSPSSTDNSTSNDGNSDETDSTSSSTSSSADSSTITDGNSSPTGSSSTANFPSTDETAVELTSGTSSSENTHATSSSNTATFPSTDETGELTSETSSSGAGTTITNDASSTDSITSSNGTTGHTTDITSIGNGTEVTSDDNTLSAITSDVTSAVSSSSTIEDGSSTNEQEEVEESDNSGMLGGVSIALGVASILICLAIMVILLVYLIVRSKRSPSTDDVTEAHVNSVSISLSPLRQWEIKFEDLTIGYELGRGAFGRVFKAQWRNSECVVKQMNFDSKNQAVMEDFLKEAMHMKYYISSKNFLSIHRNIRPHPHVLALMGVCTNPKHPICIVTEYLPEGNLWDLLRKLEVNITSSMAITIIKDIASGMSHLHSENVLHCDLAARNVLISSLSKDVCRVKVGDFGLSHISNDDTYNAKAETKFPIRWAAPEALLQKTLSKAGDVWSFGIVIWEILERAIPYAAMSNVEVTKYVTEGKRLPPPSRIEYPQELTQMMTSCWQKDPAKRPTFENLYKTLSQLAVTTTKNVVHIEEQQEGYISVIIQDEPVFYNGATD